MAKPIDYERGWSALVEVMDFAGPQDRQRTLGELGVDSIGVLEWFYVLDEEFELGLNIEDDALFEGIEDMKVAGVLDRLSVVSGAKPG